MVGVDWVVEVVDVVGVVGVVWLVGVVGDVGMVGTLSSETPLPRVICHVMYVKLMLLL